MCHWYSNFGSTQTRTEEAKDSRVIHITQHRDISCDFQKRFVVVRIQKLHVISHVSNMILYSIFFSLQVISIYRYKQFSKNI